MEKCLLKIFFGISKKFCVNLPKVGGVKNERLKSEGEGKSKIN